MNPTSTYAGILLSFQSSQTSSCCRCRLQGKSPVSCRELRKIYVRRSEKLQCSTSEPTQVYLNCSESIDSNTDSDCRSAAVLCSMRKKSVMSRSSREITDSIPPRFLMAAVVNLYRTAAGRAILHTSVGKYSYDLGSKSHCPT